MEMRMKTHCRSKKCMDRDNQASILTMGWVLCQVECILVPTEREQIYRSIEKPVCRTSASACNCAKVTNSNHAVF